MAAWAKCALFVDEILRTLTIKRKAHAVAWAFKRILIGLSSVVVFLIIILLRSVVFFSVVSYDFHGLFRGSLILILALFLGKRPDRYKPEHRYHQQLSY